MIGSADTSDGSRHAFIWTDGTLLDLGTLSGPNSRAVEINHGSQIVGTADTSDGSRHAFLWEDGVMQDLGLLPDASGSEALGINDQSQVVGDVTVPSSGQGLFSVVPQAFLYSDGELAQLGGLRAARPDRGPKTVPCPGSGVRQRVILTWSCD